jgi:hypothetical protein
MPWVSVSAPFIGTITTTGVDDGGDGWFTVVVGLLVVLVGGLGVSGRRLAAIPPIALPIAGLVAALGLAALGILEVVNISRKEAQLRGPGVER